MEWVTTSTLLVRLHDPDDESAWHGLSEVFGQAVERFARAQGLDAESARDVAQETLLSFVQGYRAGRYDRARGRLRSWLFGIARNQVRSVHRGHRRRPSCSLEALGSDADGREYEPVDEAAGAALAASWEQEWLRAIYGRCLRSVRRQVTDTTYAIYARSLEEDRSTDEIAREFGVAPTVVYNARSRVWKRIQDCARAFEDA